MRAFLLAVLDRLRARCRRAIERWRRVGRWRWRWRTRGSRRWCRCLRGGPGCRRRTAQHVFSQFDPAVSRQARQQRCDQARDHASIDSASQKPMAPWLPPHQQRSSRDGGGQHGPGLPLRPRFGARSLARSKQFGHGAQGGAVPPRDHPVDPRPDQRKSAECRQQSPSALTSPLLGSVCVGCCRIQRQHLFAHRASRLLETLGSVLHAVG